MLYYVQEFGYLLKAEINNSASLVVAHREKGCFFNCARVCRQQIAVLYIYYSRQKKRKMRISNNTIIYFYYYLVLFLILAVSHGKYAGERKTSSPSTSSHALNPSFRKPTYMRYVNSKKHTPGKDVILVCMTTGVKPITHTWLYNGNIIQENGNKKRLKFVEDRLVRFCLLFM